VAESKLLQATKAQLAKAIRVKRRWLEMCSDMG